MLLQTAENICLSFRKSATDLHLSSAQASTSSSDGMLTLDLIQEEDTVSQEANSCKNFSVEEGQSHLSLECPRSKTEGALSARTEEVSVKSHSLPRERVVVWEQTAPTQCSQPGKCLTPAEKNRCASMDEILSHSETKAAKNKTTVTSRSAASTPTGTTMPIDQLQDLISQKLEKTERLLGEVQGEAAGGTGERGKVKGKESAEAARAEAERLLREAKAAWSQAQEVLEEVKELRALYRQLDSSSPITPSKSTKLNPDRKSLMWVRGTCCGTQVQTSLVQVKPQSWRQLLVLVAGLQKKLLQTGWTTFKLSGKIQVLILCSGA